MDMHTEGQLSCLCGRSFPQAGPLKHHQKSCKKSKTRMFGALERAKESWTARKRQRIENLEGESSGANQSSSGHEEFNVMANNVCFFPDRSLQQLTSTIISQVLPTIQHEASHGTPHSSPAVEVCLSVSRASCN